MKYIYNIVSMHIICLHYLLTKKNKNKLNEFQLIIELINLHVNK